MAHHTCRTTPGTSGEPSSTRFVEACCLGEWLADGRVGWHGRDLCVLRTTNLNMSATPHTVADCAPCLTEVNTHRGPAFSTCSGSGSGGWSSSMLQSGAVFLRSRKGWTLSAPTGFLFSSLPCFSLRSI
eukprot:2045458-Rhodomonas_salina.4